MDKPRATFPTLLRVGVRAGADIGDTLVEMMATSCEYRVPVEGEHSGITITVDAAAALAATRADWIAKRNKRATPAEKDGNE
jgi:hypothetical protein